jgi:hypothetical protein
MSKFLKPIASAMMFNIFAVGLKVCRASAQDTEPTRHVYGS